MGRFSGPVGFATSVESAPGVWKDTIVERNYSGDVVRDTRRLLEGDKVNNDLTIGNSIEILSDSYATDNIMAIRYVKWNNVFWKVPEVEVKHPRLLLRLGGIYNGNKA